MTIAQDIIKYVTTKGGFLSDSANRFSYLSKNIVSPSTKVWDFDKKWLHWVSVSKIMVLIVVLPY